MIPGGFCICWVIFTLFTIRNRPLRHVIWGFWLTLVEIKAQTTSQGIIFFQLSQNIWKIQVWRTFKTVTSFCQCALGWFESLGYKEREYLNNVSYSKHPSCK